MSIRLYVGNLPKEEVDRAELQAVFADAGNSVSTKVIKDRKTGKCRGFGFVTVQTDEQADQFIEKFNGQMFRDSALKIEKALPRSKGGPSEDEPKPASSSPSSSPTTSSSPSSSAPSGGGSSRRNNKKSRRPTATSSTSSSSDAIQPDPRWAHALEELKQRLAAQATNP